MTTRSSSRDRTPPRRAVPALVAAGLLLLNAWLLLAIGRLDHQPHPQPLNSDGPTSIAIPAIGVHAQIVAVGLQANGAMQVPDPDQVGWYRLGPRPGAAGPAVLIGHVDNRTGPAVFYRLRQLRPGDQILIGQSDGTTSRFLVGRLEQHPKTALPTSHIFSPRPAAPAPDHLRRPLQPPHPPLPRQRYRLRLPNRQLNEDGTACTTNMPNSARPWPTSTSPQLREHATRQRLLATASPPRQRRSSPRRRWQLLNRRPTPRTS